MTDNKNFLDALAADLVPVRRMQPRGGIVLSLMSSFIAALSVIAYFGARDDIAAFTPNPLVIIRCLLLVLLGLATSVAVTNAARPSVGRASNGWVWALAAVMVLPAAGFLLYCYHMLAHIPFTGDDMDFQFGPYCLAISITSAVLIGSVQTLWLRRGAPTDINRAGWLVGLGAGSFGTFAYSLHCPSNSIYYISVFYSLAVGLCAVAGRLIVPRLIRW